MTEYIEHPDFDTYRLSFTSQSLRNYMRQVLSGLETMHSKGIIHRDIKPHNIFYNPETEKLKIADLGLAEQFNIESPMSYKVAARFFKAPELLMEMEFYFFSVDIWAVGVIFASIVGSPDFQKIPVFRRGVQHRPADQNRGGPGVGGNFALPVQLQVGHAGPV